MSQPVHSYFPDIPVQLPPHPRPPGVITGGALQLLVAHAKAMLLEAIKVNATTIDKTNLIGHSPQNTNQKNERQRTVVDWTKGKSSTIGGTNLLLPVRCMPSAFESNSVVRRRKQLRRADTDTTKKPRPNGLTRLRD